MIARRSWDYLDRAKAAGAGAIVLTVDLAPAAAATFRKTVQNQLTSIPGNFPDLTWAQMSASFAPGSTLDDIAEVVDRTGLPVHVKGVLQAADAVGRSTPAPPESWCPTTVAGSWPG